MDDFNLDEFLDRYAPVEKQNAAKDAKAEISTVKGAFDKKPTVSDRWGHGLLNILNND